MEISNISGPDMMPQSSAIQAPRQEESPREEPERVNKGTEATDTSKGTTIDTYA